MLHKMGSVRHWRAFVSISTLVLALFVMLYTGFASDIATGILFRLPQMKLGLGHHAPPEHFGPASLEERIVGADVIARVRLRSVSQVIEANAFYDGETLYSGALDLKFQVLEYLKGKGGSELTAVVFDTDLTFKTKLGARTMGEDFIAGRDTNWDNREAIVFLASDHPSLPSSYEPDRYALGILRFNGEERYTIASRYSKHWLPAAVATGAVGASRGSEQRFLTGGVPVNVQTRGASGVSGDASDMTLAALKTRISEVDREVDAGDGSKEYRECVHAKYEWAREMQWRFNYLKSRRPDLDFYEREDYDFGSGLPARSEVLRDRFAGYTEAYNAHDPNQYWLSGEDAGLFDYNHPGVVTSIRPLPDGDYRFYAHERLSKLIICDAYPDILREHREIFVRVAPSSGTAHEAFFDPVAIGTAVGADDTNGVLKPASFTFKGVGDVSIERIEWESGSVEMELAPHSRLADHHIDFIALDGKVSLRLDFDDATEVDEDGIRALSWGVCEQPWSDGDLLMLRIGSGIPADGVSATNEPECQSSLPDQISVPTAVPTTEPTPERTATAEPTAEPTPKPERTATPEPIAEPTPKPEPTVTPEPAVTRETEPTVTATTTPERVSERTATSEPTATPSP